MQDIFKLGVTAKKKITCRVSINNILDATSAYRVIQKHFSNLIDYLCFQYVTHWLYRFWQYRGERAHKKLSLSVRINGDSG